MNNETYEALKRIMAYHDKKDYAKGFDVDNDKILIDDWIDEVAKEYVDEEVQAVIDSALEREDEDHPNPEIEAVKAEAKRDGLREEGIK